MALDQRLIPGLITVDLHALAPGGDAVGRQCDGAAVGRVVFVARGAPGDRVRARVVREKKRMAWAEIEEILVASPARVVPPCSRFSDCGGCQWQHVSYPAQKAAKSAIVARALGLPDVQLHSPVSPFGYRERARFVASADGAFGFHARRSRRVVDVPACPLLAPPLNQALADLRAHDKAYAADSEVSVQMGADGVVAARSGSQSWWVGAAVGDEVNIEVDVAERGSAPLKIPPGAFCQVSGAANHALVKAVHEAIGLQPGRVLELFAGSGNFTRGLIQVASGVVAHDADPQARRRGARNVPAATWPDDVADLVGRFDTALVDPPREGLDAPTLKLAIQARSRLVYVSCDPQTLGRDARLIEAAGFRLKHAVAFDLMPQTFHVEVVALFERGVRFGQTALSPH